MHELAKKATENKDSELTSTNENGENIQLNQIESIWEEDTIENTINKSKEIDDVEEDIKIEEVLSQEKTELTEIISPENLEAEFEETVNSIEVDAEMEAEEAIVFETGVDIDLEEIYEVDEIDSDEINELDKDLEFEENEIEPVLLQEAEKESQLASDDTSIENGINAQESEVPITSTAEKKSTFGLPAKLPSDKKTPQKRGRKSFKEIDATVDLIELPSDEELYKKQYYSISTVANWFKVNTSLIRFWENEFDILKPRKNRKGDRMFRPEDVKNLALIHHLLRHKKYTIDGAKDFLKGNKKKADTELQLTQTLQKFKSFLLELKANLQA